jgi:hypothetical protein
MADPRLCRDGAAGRPRRLALRSASRAVATRLVPSAVSPGPGAPRRSRWCAIVNRLRARPALTAGVIYAMLSLLMVGQGLLPGRTLSSSDYLWSATPWSTSRPAGVQPSGSNFELGDATEVFQPFLAYTRSVLPHVPLWNPFIGSGRPFVGNAQSAVFSPFSLPAYVLSFWRSLAVIAALKLFVAAFGTYLLGRALGMRFGGALLAGVVYAFGQFIVSWLSWPASSVWVWIPWLLLMTEHLVRRADSLSVTGLAAVVALQYLGGHPESSLHAVFVTVAFFALRVLQARRAGGSVAVPAVAFGVGLIAGTALAAIALVPVLELLSHSDQIAHRAASVALVGAQHEPPRSLLTLFFPYYWGRATQTQIEPYIWGFRVEIAYYAGALTLMLAVGALVLRRSAERVAVAAFGVLSLAIVVGLEPIFGIVTSLPGFHTAQNSRMAVLFLLCVALLAGWGLDDLSGRRPTPWRRRALIGLSGALLCLPLVWVALRGELSLGHLGRALDVAWGFVKPAGVPFLSRRAPQIIPEAALLGWVVLAGASLALVVLRLRERLAAPAFVVLAVALVVADLFRVGMGTNPAIPISHAVQPTTGAIRYLQSRRPNRFVGVAAGGFGVQPLPANVAMRYGLYDARAYDFPVERRYDRIWTRNLIRTGVDSVPTIAPVTPRTLNVLRLLSVADLLQRPTDPPLRLPGLRLVYSAVDARVYAYDRALPRVFVVGRQQVVGGADRAMAAVTRPRFDGLQAAVTERAIPGLAQNAQSKPPPRGQARLVSYGAERVVATATTSRPGLLVLTDNYFPGWKASVDGRPTPIYRVDYLLRGVPLPAGSHRVVFSYQPASWRWGRIISGLTLLAVLVAALVGWRRRRRPATAQPDGHPNPRVPRSPQAKAPKSSTVRTTSRASKPG